MGFCGKPARKPHFVADCLLADKPIHLQVYLQGRVLVWRSEATPLVSRQAHALSSFYKIFVEFCSVCKIYIRLCYNVNNTNVKEQL